MSQSFSDSIVLITSITPEEDSFGTGFIIDRDEQGTYVLTCAHVVRDVGGSEKVVVNGFPAETIASGERKGFDLAVLRVKGLSSKPQLSLSIMGKERKSFVISGFYKFSRKAAPALRKIRGNLGDTIQISSSDGRDRIDAWDLIIEGRHHLQPGYSGSPVIDEARGHVLGVVSHQVSQGVEGIAISIDALNKVWPEMPLKPGDNLEKTETEDDSYVFTGISPERLQEKLERTQNKIEQKSQEYNDLREKIDFLVKEIHKAIDPDAKYSLAKKREGYEEELNKVDREIDELVTLENLTQQNLQRAKYLKAKARKPKIG